MTSPIRTDGSALTRPKDNLQFVAGANIGGEDVGQGTIRADVLLADYNTTANVLFAISDGGAAADRIVGYVSSAELFTFTTSASGGNGGAGNVAGDCTNGVKHELALLYDTDNVRVIRDGSEGTADSSADIPDDLDALAIGQNNTATLQTNGLIQNLRIYNIPTTKG